MALTTRVLYNAALALRGMFPGAARSRCTDQASVFLFHVGVRVASSIM